ncbi:MAG: diadenylate cyclase CdaA [Kiritimatiellae bacterium]|nr:diadenylate cyclase CdaA [Kiritimatiellia bacterium]
MFEGWWPSLTDAFQILLLAITFYYILRYLKGTRAAQMLLGVAALLTIIFTITTFLELDVLNVILRWFAIVLLLALLVVFHPELRRALSMLGRNSYVQLLQGRIPPTPAERIVSAARKLAQRRLGALIAIERSVSLDRWINENSVPLDALLSDELMISIFTPPLPLHDGGVILRGDRIVAAHCFFPLDNELSVENVGTRHRAALTLSSECDAIILIVSEERGQISVARDDYLIRDLSNRQLERILRAAFVPESEQKNFFKAVFGPKHTVPWLLRPFISKNPNPNKDAADA